MSIALLVQLIVCDFDCKSCNFFASYFVQSHAISDHLPLCMLHHQILRSLGLELTNHCPQTLILLVGRVSCCGVVDDLPNVALICQ